MENILQQIKELVWPYVPHLVWALAVLAVGWLAALGAFAIIRGMLRRTTLNERVSRWVVREEGAKALPVEEWVAKGIYYLIMLLVVVAFFEALKLTLVTEPLNRFLDQVFQYLPRLVSAAILLFVAWIVAAVIRFIVLKASTTAKLDERIGEQVAKEGKARFPITKMLSDGMYWLVFLLFLPAVLGALDLQGPLGPVQAMIHKILNYLPNLVGAGIILVIGWFVARIVQKVVTQVFANSGVDRLSERVGLAPILGEKNLSGLLGLVLYILILIPVLVAALQALQLDAVTQPASAMLSQVLLTLPHIFAAGLLLLIAYLVGRVVASLLTNLLSGIGFNNILVRLGVGKELVSSATTPSEYVGFLALIAILLFAGIEAFRLLGFDALAGLLTDFTKFGGHLLLGLIIFAIGLLISNWAYSSIRASATAQANLLAIAARVAILVLVGAMALTEMGLAQRIIILAFGLSLGAVAIAFALAFGLGGRDIAAEHMEEWVKSLKSNKKD